MVGWFGAAALALVGGLKGQGNPWRQIPLVGVLAATALFISWRVRHGREKDTPKPPKPDEKTVAEVNTRMYLVYDEEKKLEFSTSRSQSLPASYEGESGKFADTNGLGSASVEVEDIGENSSQIPLGQNFESLNRTGGESLPVAVCVESKRDAECRDVEEISKCEGTTDGVRTAGSDLTAPKSKITDISVSGFHSHQIKSQKFFVHPEIPSVVGIGENYVYELDMEEDVNQGSLSYAAVSVVTQQEKDIIPVAVSDVASDRTAEDEYLPIFLSDRDSGQVTVGHIERLEKVLNVVESDSANNLRSVEDESGLHEIEDGAVATPDKLLQSPRVPLLPVEGFVSSTSSTLTRALDSSGVYKEAAASDRQASTLREVRAKRISPELQLNDWVSRRGDSELEDGRLTGPASATNSNPSTGAESNPGPFPFSSYSASESCNSDVMDYKDEFLTHSPPSNVKRVISDVKDLESDSRKSPEEEYGERLRSYDEYLGDPSLSPTMRSQVLRAKATLERLLYDSD